MIEGNRNFVRRRTQYLRAPVNDFGLAREEQFDRARWKLVILSASYVKFKTRTSFTTFVSERKPCAHPSAAKRSPNVPQERDEPRFFSRNRRRRRRSRSRRSGRRVASPSPGSRYACAASASEATTSLTRASTGEAPRSRRAGVAICAEITPLRRSIPRRRFKRRYAVPRVRARNRRARECRW